MIDNYIFTTFDLSLLSSIALILLALLFSSYVKIAVVLNIVRLGFGFTSLPTLFITIGLALTCSYFVMYPTLVEVSDVLKENSSAQVKLSEPEKTVVFDKISQIWKEFVTKHIKYNQIETFSKLAIAVDKIEKIDEPDKENLNSSWRVLAPAFLVSELKEAFRMGFMLFLPFLIIDLVIGTVLAAISLENLSPYLVALPLKLLLFIAVDGWSLICKGIISSYM
ncbi:MAG: EscR/YscR/HrcR family type III secretion system export apparatus protein [Deltaproteobacteria bacterium]|jgi:flagellar biosynthesis protein FliP|nr:EscR/YscR/HrcR family type III secretion system export apparatus protein [Deltaproteobacteria bacterium]